MRLGEVKFIIENIPRKIGRFKAIFIYPASPRYLGEIIIYDVVGDVIISYKRLLIDNVREYNEVFDSIIMPTITADEKREFDYFMIATCQQGLCYDGSFKLLALRNLLTDEREVNDIRELVMKALNIIVRKK